MDPFRPIPDLRALSRNYSLADVFVERMENWIVNLQKKLPPGQQLRITALLPGGREVLVEWIGYHNPNLVAINGVDLQSANACTLLAHQEAIQFLYVKIGRAHVSTP